MFEFLSKDYSRTFVDLNRSVVLRPLVLSESSLSKPFERMFSILISILIFTVRSASNLDRQHEKPISLAAKATSDIGLFPYKKLID